MRDEKTNDDTMVVVTKTKLKAFEKAVQEEADATLQARRASDAFDHARAELERAREAQSAAKDARSATTQALYEDEKAAKR